MIYRDGWQSIRTVSLVGLLGGLTKQYHVHKFVYFEEYSEVNGAIAREKQLKGWVRAKKNWLIESQNPNWNDLSESFV
jgi:putative endonuclease